MASVETATAALATVVAVAASAAAAAAAVVVVVVVVIFVVEANGVPDADIIAVDHLPSLPPGRDVGGRGGHSSREGGKVVRVLGGRRGVATLCTTLQHAMYEFLFIRVLGTIRTSSCRVGFEIFNGRSLGRGKTYDISYVVCMYRESAAESRGMPVCFIYLLSSSFKETMESLRVLSQELKNGRCD